ncbi:MAG: hypothetical protein M1828_003647 [Chrysothrix sp. TS-e1954]|nr:MAG: hypothetical protein M1828_003647 [Chrysothrix sp. TS-e1954]
MSGDRPPQIQLGATFTPGGFDDFYMPEPGVVSPAPQRVNHEMPGQIQQGMKAMELGSSGPNAGSPQVDSSPSSIYSPGQPQPLFNGRGAPSSTLQPSQHEGPNYSGLPKLQNRTPNVPPSDDEKEQTLETARVPVLSSTDVDMQLQWAQDTLSFVDVAAEFAQRTSLNPGSRPTTPRIEHQLRVDAVNIVSFMADQHHPKAEFMRGIWLEFGKFGCREDKGEAFRCYRRAAEKGYARAEYRMGMQYELGNDHGKAVHHYQTGAAAGDSASCYRMGMVALLGQLSQPQDVTAGVNLVRHAADTADENAPQGAYVYGMLRARDLPQINVPDHLLSKDLMSARTYIEKSAFMGFSKAQLKMGSCYELAALGCEFDPMLSLHYNALAARQGEPEAELAISKWFLCGYDGAFDKNDELAYRHAQRASLSGLPAADFAMGYFSEVGIYVASDLNVAKTFYQKAAEQGNKDARDRLDSILASNVMSKKDHENIAITRIKSTHASMRGQRPQRLNNNRPVDPLPTVQDQAEPPGSRYGSPRPPRASSVAPYPDEHGSTATPYPDGNYHHSAAPPHKPDSISYPGDSRQGMTTMPPSSQAYGGQSAGRGAGAQPLRQYQSAANVASGPQQPLRGYSSVNDMGGGKAHQAPQPYRAGAPPPGGFHPPPSQAQAPMRPPKDLGPQMSATPPPSRINIGYSAPPDPSLEHKYQLKQQPVPHRPGLDSKSSVSSISTTSSIPHPHHSPRPSGDRHPSQPQPRPDQRPETHNTRPDPRSKTPQPPNSAATSTAAPARIPGRGPKTFEEMGVPAGKAESDCATEISANLHNKVTKAAATKYLKDMYERKMIEERASGKQLVYHAIQVLSVVPDSALDTSRTSSTTDPRKDPADISNPSGLAELTANISTMQSETSALQADLKSLKLQLNIFESTPSLAELQSSIESLEHEKLEMSERLVGLRSGSAKRVDNEEKLAVEAELKKVSGIVNARERIVRDVWAIVRDGLPEGKKESELKEELAWQTRAKSTLSLTKDIMAHRSRSPNPQTSQGFLSYPVKYAVTSALRRLASDSPSRAPKAATLSTSSSSTNLAEQSHLSGTYTPPRNTPPFQPPPLTPLSQAGYTSNTPPKAQLLSRLLAEEIRLLIPPRLQLCSTWRLLFGLEQDGASLSTLYTKCASTRGQRGGFVLVVRDNGGGLFGAYVTDPPGPSAGHYYGTGECFLWRASTLPRMPLLDSLPPPPSADTTHAQRMTTIASPDESRKMSLPRPAVAAGFLSVENGGSGTTTPRSGTSTPERIRFKAFPYSGENDFLIFCETGFMSLGGGDGHYGLWLDANLEKGISQTCPTFGNEELSDEGPKFDVLGAEVWWVQ